MVDKTPQTPTTLSPSEFETYLRIAREQHVSAFKLGDMAVQFEPDPGPTTLATEAAPKTAGNWKRGPDLDEDPELKEWD